MNEKWIMCAEVIVFGKARRAHQRVSLSVLMNLTGVQGYLYKVIFGKAGDVLKSYSQEKNMQELMMRRLKRFILLIPAAALFTLSLKHAPVSLRPPSQKAHCALTGSAPFLDNRLEDMSCQTR